MKYHYWKLLLISIGLLSVCLFINTSSQATDFGDPTKYFHGTPGPVASPAPTVVPTPWQKIPKCVPPGKPNPCPKDPKDPLDPNQCTTGHPISLFDGKFYLRHSDLVIPARLPIGIERNYTSYSTFNGPFGYGWSMSYNERLFRDKNANLVLRRSNQWISDFTYQTATADYRGETGDYDIITYNTQSDLYTLTKKDGMVNDFDSDGKLTKIYDIDGNQLLLSYDPAGKLPINGRSEFSNFTTPIVIARDYRLLEVNEGRNDIATGRFVEYSYNDNGRVIAVSFHSSTESGPIRTYSYGYDTEGWGNLVSVEDPEGNEHTYGYEGHLITEYSGSGCSECLTYRNEYDSKKRAIRQELGPEGLATEIEIEYGDGEGSRIVTTVVKDNEGNTSRSLVEEFYFDEDGHTIMKVKKPGGGLDDVVTEYTYSDDKMIQKIDPRGTVTDYTYNDWGNLASEVVNLGDDKTLTKTWTYDTDTHKKSSEEITLSNEGQTYRKEWVYFAQDTDAAGNLWKKIRVMDGDDLVTEYEYDEYGDITTITDPMGIETTYTYNNYGLRSEKDEADGEKITRYGSNVFGNQTEVTEAYGTSLARITYYTYDRLNRITQIQHPTTPTTYTIRDYNYLKLVEEEIGNTGTSGSGHSTYYDFDDFNRQSAIQKETDSGTVTILSYTRDSEGKKLSETDGNGNTTYYEYDGLGRLTTVTRLADRETRFFYDANGNLIKKIDPLDNITVYTYNKLNQLTEEKAIGTGMNLVTQYTYTGLGKVEEKNQKLGSSWITTTYDYDRSGRRTTVNKPLSASSYYSYDKNSNWVGFTDAEGNDTVYGYNDLNQLSSRTNALGVTTEYTLDELGRRTSIIEAKDTEVERMTNCKYGNFNLPTKTWVTFNSQTLETTFSYDLFGNMTAQTDANGNGTTYSYDFFNRKTNKTNAEGHTISYSYDTIGNWTGLTDPNGNFTRYIYTANNEPWATVYPNFTAETNIYDAAGNRTSKITRAGEIITFEYDDFNRLTKKTYSDSSETTYDYDVLGRMTAAENDNSDYEFTYNDLNQVTVAQFTDDTDNEYTISYEWDKVGNKTKITYPESYYYYSRTYDALNRLDLVKDRDNSNIADYTYDDLNRRSRRDYLNNTWTTYTYNEIGWLTDLVNWRMETDIISSFAYTQDNVGNRLTMTTSFGTQTYFYDKIYEVTGADYPAFYAFSDMNFQYDACWNRESTVDGGTTNYLANNLNQYTSVGGIAYTHDANGNLTNDGIQTYYYDCENKLNKVVRDSDGTTLGEYRYDPFGKRIRKIADGVIINYIYDLRRYQVIVEYEDDGGGFELARSFIYGVGIDEPLMMVQDEEQNFYCRNGLGSVMGLTDSDGDTVKEYEYAIYGDSSSSGSLTGNPYNFTGRRYDSESGLFYFRARYYDAELGRFLQTDPVVYKEGPNLYSYVLNSPINLLDSSGMELHDWDWDNRPIFGPDLPGSGFSPPDKDFPCDLLGLAYCITNIGSEPYELAICAICAATTLTGCPDMAACNECAEIFVNGLITCLGIHCR